MFNHFGDQAQSTEKSSLAIIDYEPKYHLIYNAYNS